MDSRLALGLVEQAVDEAEALRRDHPLDEGSGGLLMPALHRAGRQADALAVCREIRCGLREELGLDPGDTLTGLEAAILRQDPDLRRGQFPMTRGSGRTEPVTLRPAGTPVPAQLPGAVHVVGREAETGVLDALLRTRDRPVPAGSGRHRRGHRDRRRVLILLDNARDAGQVRPLLPGAPGCLVVVTSRDRLTSLVACEGAVPVPLDVLSPAAAHDLLIQRLGRVRVAVEQGAVRSVIENCEGLPLALGLAAAWAATHPRLPIAAFAELIRELTRAALLTEYAPGRFGAHDLLCRFAWLESIAHDPEEFRADGVRRLLEHYLYTAVGAAPPVVPDAPRITPSAARPGVEPERFTSRAAALVWFRTEHAELLAAVEKFLIDGLDAPARQLAVVLVPVLRADRRRTDPAAVGLLTRAVAAATDPAPGTSGFSAASVSGQRVGPR